MNLLVSISGALTACESRAVVRRVNPAPPRTPSSTDDRREVRGQVRYTAHVRRRVRPPMTDMPYPASRPATAAGLYRQHADRLGDVARISVCV